MPADNTISTAKIQNDAITGAKIENNPTIAGNLTLTGSAANLIVAEQAMRIDRENTLDFWRHIKVCFWVCVISCTVGSFLILMAEAIN